MYVCGITPYDTTHLGHAFTYITFDILQRVLTFKGYSVTYTQNVTDIDDDILKRAKENRRHSREGGNPDMGNWQELGEFWTKKFLNDLNDLNILMPTSFVKATDSIPTMLEIIRILIAKDFAYEKNGNVYFRVKNDPDYGKLSKYSREEMLKLSKERGADPDDPRKEDLLDFILWQKSKPEEPFWESPYGNGRPGWHIECSAMVYKYLDKNIDIHGGGIDLIYPHHESEIAQSEHFTGVKPFVKYWMHTGAVGYQGEKMSKSLGNLVMVSDLLKIYSPNAIRYLLLSHHYRQPWEFEETELKEAEKKMKTIISSLSEQMRVEEPSLRQAQTKTSNITDQLVQTLEDDLDTPKALGLLNKLSGKPLQEALLLLGFYL